MPSFSCRDLKREILDLLAKRDLPFILEEVKNFPPKKTINVLIGALCHREEEVRWKAIAAIGPVVAQIAAKDLEAARVIVRRFMWMLNEESGGMAWGVPEAMAESLANHRKLAEEYTSILISYIWEEGNYLEYPPAQRGVVWGIGRLAQVFPDLLEKHKAPQYALHLSDSSDPFVRAFWMWAYLQMKPLIGGLKEEVVCKLKKMPTSELDLLFYDGNDLRRVSYAELLKEALKAYS
ncbi:DVU0298 family protein [Thermodesulfatator atlanticus]